MARRVTGGRRADRERPGLPPLLIMGAQCSHYPAGGSFRCGSRGRAWLMHPTGKCPGGPVCLTCARLTVSEYRRVYRLDGDALLRGWYVEPATEYRGDARWYDPLLSALLHARAWHRDTAESALSRTFATAGRARLEALKGTMTTGGTP